MYLIAGLGNPGKEYANTRHNVGFVAIDYLAAKNNVSLSKIKFKSLCGEGFIGGEKCLLMKPQTFMNKSGEAVKAAADFYKLDADKIVIIYDDFALKLGQIRIRKGGSNGGHNGMGNIIYLMQTDQIKRIRFGVGAPEHGAVDYVLGTFSEEDGAVMTDSVKKIADIIPIIIKDGIDAAMNKFNSEKGTNNESNK